MNEEKQTGILSFEGKTTVTSNIDRHIIQINEDRLHLCLLTYVTSLKDADAWQLPVSLALTFLLTIVTTEPIAVFSLTADTWKAVFLIALILSILWLLNCLRQQRNKMTLDELITHIKEHA